MTNVADTADVRVTTTEQLLEGPYEVHANFGYPIAHTTRYGMANLTLLKIYADVYFNQPHGRGHLYDRVLYARNSLTGQLATYRLKGKQDASNSSSPLQG